MYVLVNLAQPGFVCPVWTIVGEDGNGHFEIASWELAVYVLGLFVRYGAGTAERYAMGYRSETLDWIKRGNAGVPSFKYPKVEPRNSSTVPVQAVWDGTYTAAEAEACRRQVEADMVFFGWK